MPPPTMIIKGWIKEDTKLWKSHGAMKIAESNVSESDMSIVLKRLLLLPFFGTIGIAIAIAKAIFQLLLLILQGEFFNYCYWYC